MAVYWIAYLTQEVSKYKMNYKICQQVVVKGTDDSVVQVQQTKQSYYHVQ
jgi:hypothetical protein